MEWWNIGILEYWNDGKLGKVSYGLRITSCGLRVRKTKRKAHSA